jgi:hypothetical protein
MRSYFIGALPRERPVNGGGESTETENGLPLRAIVDNTSADALAQWPMLRSDDYSLIGGYIVLYSYIDFNLRRMVESVEEAGELRFGKGKAGLLTIADVERAIQTVPEIYQGANKIAIDRIIDLRGMRNLLAHFSIRRFPEDEAFLFVTRSFRDYQREFGSEPQPNEALTAITEIEQIREAQKEVERLLDWLSKATVQVEEQWLPPLA